MIGQFPWEPFPPEEPEPKGPDPVPRGAYQAAVTAADAYRCVRAALRREEGVLRVGNRFVADGRYRQVAFVALGNAANSMALGALHAIGDRLTQGYLAGPDPVPEEIPFRGEAVPLGLPGFRGAEGVVRAVTEIAEGLGPQDLFLLLVSPGALGAISVPPAGVSPEEFGHLFEAAGAAGATGRELELLGRTLGEGGVGGRLGAACGRSDTATFVIDRGDGPRSVGGGPVDPVLPAERDEARSVLERVGLSPRLSPALAARLAGTTGEVVIPPSVARPVVVAAPSDALRAAADSTFDRGWTSRLGFLQMREPPELGAERFMAKAEELVAAENLTSSSRTKGVAVLAMTTLGLPEGVDEGPALAAFLTRARELARRREMSVTLARTVGALGSSAFPPAAIFGPPTDSRTPVPVGRARGLPMHTGITDVGLLALALCALPGSTDPR
ncbi:MAG TPA: DUF4147 domain-containing protein [Thermoplasmata archaeon]|nr:DUF4147 domain-containing protein [Thermoplasmata archaeon]